MQYIYQQEQNGKDPEPIRTMELYSTLLLETRKSVGHQSTELEQIDMLKGTISDASELEGELNN